MSRSRVAHWIGLAMDHAGRWARALAAGWYCRRGDHRWWFDVTTDTYRCKDCGAHESIREWRSR